MIIVFDMDECIASLSEPCNIYHHYKLKGTDPPDTFSEELQLGLKQLYLRPGIDDILSTLAGFKFTFDNDSYNVIRVTHIILMTNSSNEYGWVDYIVSQIEKCIHSKMVIAYRIFDRIIHRETPERTSVTERQMIDKYGGMQPKFMDDVYRILNINNTIPILMYDDNDAHLVPSKHAKSHFVKVSQYHSYERHKHTHFETFTIFMPPLIQAMKS